MEVLTTGISWWAVGVSTVICFILGGLWYSPLLFLKPWSEGVGLEVTEPAAPPVMAMVLQLTGTFFLAWVIALIAANAAWPVVVLIVISMTTLLISANLFSAHSMVAALVQGLYVVAMAVVMTVCNLLL